MRILYAVCKALSPESEQNREIIRLATREYVPGRSLTATLPTKGKKTLRNYMDVSGQAVECVHSRGH